MVLLKTKVVPTDISKGFSSILLRAGTDDKFAKFLKDKKLWNPQDIVLLCQSDEAMIEKKILNPFKLYTSVDVTSDLAPDVEVAIRRAWRLCNDMLTDPREESDGIDPVLSLIHI